MKKQISVTDYLSGVSLAEQKIVWLSGPESYLMDNDGEPDRRDPHRKCVLPGLLAEGWRVVQMVGGGMGPTSKPCGYALLERSVLGIEEEEPEQARRPVCNCRSTAEHYQSGCAAR